jgi:hypothetical protein
VPTKILLKVGFLERDFESDHLAEKSYSTKKGQKIHCEVVIFIRVEKNITKWYFLNTRVAKKISRTIIAKL